MFKPLALSVVLAVGCNQEGEVRTIAEFPPGTFLENLVRVDDGIIATSYFDQRLVAISDAGEVSIFAQLATHPIGIVSVPGGFVVSAQAIPFTEFPGVLDANQIVVLDAEGSVTQTTDATDAAFLNGLHVLDSGTVLAADSIAGVIWEVDPTTGAIDPFRADDAFLPLPDQTEFLPGANGLKSHDGQLYVSNSSQGTIVRLDESGEGAVERFATTGEVDDFDVASDGTLFAATHGETLLRIGPDGSVRTLLEAGCDGCTAVALSKNERRITVVNDGNLFVGGSDPARVFEVRTGR